MPVNFFEAITAFFCGAVITMDFSIGGREKLSISRVAAYWEWDELGQSQKEHFLFISKQRPVEEIEEIKNFDPFADIPF